MSTTMSSLRERAHLDDVRRRVRRRLDRGATAEPTTGNEPGAAATDDVAEPAIERAGGVAIDLIEEPDRFVLRADVPGMAPADVSIEVDGSKLRVRGEHGSASEMRQGSSVLRERRFGAFVRELQMPAGVTAEDVGATMRGGILEVTYPNPGVTEPTTVAIETTET